MSYVVTIDEEERAALAAALGVLNEIDNTALDFPHWVDAPERGGLLRLSAVLAGIAAEGRLVIPPAPKKPPRINGSSTQEEES